MLGTIAELQAFYVPGEDLHSASEDMLDTVIDNLTALGGWSLTDFMSLYGASPSTGVVISQIAGGAEAGPNLTPPLQNHQTKLALDAELTTAMAKNNLDASNLPLVHRSWGRQKIDVADGGNLAVGRIVYIALRIGLLTQENPFPYGIAAVVVAASAASFKYGSWTSQASSAAKEATVDEVGAWGDDNRVYVLLPRQCFLGPGATGDVACTAFGVGWARDGKLENYVDVLSGREEVRERFGLFRSPSSPPPLIVPFRQQGILFHTNAQVC